MKWLNVEIGQRVISKSKATPGTVVEIVQLTKDGDTKSVMVRWDNLPFQVWLWSTNSLIPLEDEVTG